MIYLASPYSHPAPTVREARYAAACRATATLIAQGCAVFSPIVHSHPLAGYNLPAEWEFWQRIDREYLRRCDDLFVLMLDGWRESTGVRAEIELAQEFQLPVYYLSETMISNMSGGVTSSSHTLRASTPAPVE